jgi:predicted DNA-binding protein with PD1-like motif
MRVSTLTDKEVVIPIVEAHEVVSRIGVVVELDEQARVVHVACGRREGESAGRVSHQSGF